ncbi:MAG: AAA family ATPase [Deltaproteobacteria bacterium]|nr:AAA family ATPase [Deltaproteobacteria bacterium]
MYKNGLGVTQNDAQAVKWYRFAADQGYSEAQFNLGLMYENGQGLQQDYVEALKWYRRAADQGLADAQSRLGLMYAHGQGVSQDYGEAKRWFDKAAEQGLPEGQRNLGIVYFYGWGIRPDYKEASRWFKLAAEHGDARSESYLREIEGQLKQKKRRPASERPKTKRGKLPKDSNASLEQLFAELNKMVGLQRVKDEIDQLIKFVRVQKMRHSQGLKADSLSLHCVFFGNPGTGKTMVARIYGKMLKALGLLSKGHLVETDRSGLVAGYVGQTELKTDQKISEALGGILFIDEAYSLFKGRDTQLDYGSEAISILLKRMEDHRDDFVVIVAGYEKPMAEFLQSNEGLKSRFSTKIRFPDYSPKELVDIFELFCKEGNYEIKSTALELVSYILNNEYRDRDETFGNGRLVRNLFQSIVRNQSVRIAETISDSKHSDLVTILPDDVRPLLEKKQEPVAPTY